MALSVVAISLGAVLQAFSRSLKNAETAKRYQIASLLAEEKVWETLWANELIEGTTSGIMEGPPEMSWSCEATLLYRPPLEETPRETAPPEGATVTGGKEAREKLPPTDLYQIVVRVSWSDQDKMREYQLATYTLIPTPEEEKGDSNVPL